MSKKIKMSFSCHKDWEEMELSGNGRYCGSCQHEVLDMTSLGYEEIRNKLSALDGNVCIKISEELAEQEEALVIDLPRSLRKMAAAASIAGAVLAIPAQTTEPTKIESASIYHEDTGKQNQAPTEIIHYQKTSELSDAKPITSRKRRRKLYVNRRFPFLHYGRYRTIGRVLGCPSF